MVGLGSVKSPSRITIKDTVVGIVGSPYILEILESELSAVDLIR